MEVPNAELTQLWKDYKSGQIDLFDLEELAMYSEFAENNDRTIYVNNYTQYVQNLDHWYQSLPTKDLPKEPTEEDINMLINSSDDTVLEKELTYQIRYNEANKLLFAALLNEKIRRCLNV